MNSLVANKFPRQRENAPAPVLGLSTGSPKAVVLARQSAMDLMAEPDAGSADVECELA